MNVKNVEKENGKAKVTVEVAKEQFDTAVEKAYFKQRKNIQVPGFRKGHAPRKVIEGMYGPTVFYEDAVNEIFPEVYTAAVTEQQLKAVGSPAIADMSFTEEGNLVLVVETELYPEVTLGDYKGIEVVKYPVEIAEAEIDAEIDRMAERNARILTVDREAKEGDTLVFDFEGFVDGVPFEGGKAEKYSLKLGSGQFIPGFEDALIGVKAGEDRDVNVTFPEQYDAKLAGKAATFKCKVHEVKETIVPEKDDEFVKDVSEFDTMEELRASIRTRMTEEREKNIRDQFENACVTAAAKNMTCDIPACMIDEQVDRHMEQFAYQLQMNGMKMEDYARMTGGDMSSLRQSMRPMAETTVRANILLSEIVVKEGITVSDEEIEAEFQKLADQYGMELEKVKEAIDAGAVRADLESRKAVRLIADNAVPVAPKDEKESAAQE